MPELKLPPQNNEAEQSVLGAMLLDQEAVYKVAEFLEPEHFYKDTHRIVYQAIIDLMSERKAIDILTLSSQLKKRKVFDKIGGSAFLSELVAGVPTAAHVEEYGKLIKEASMRRRMIHMAAKLDEMAYQEDEDLEVLLDGAERELLGISESSLDRDFIHISKLLEQSYEMAEELNKNQGQLRGIPTGFSYLDSLLGGLQKSDLIILAARPSVGKTAFSLDLARHASVIEGKSVGVFSLEMSGTQLMDRLLSMQVGIGLWDLRMGRISDEGFSRLSEAMGMLSEANLFIDDTPGIGIMEMRTKARRLKVENSLDLIIVDYLQLMQGRRQESRVQEVSEISRFLKSLARELDVPVIALSQLSRSVEQRGGDGVPQLSDLRDSGSIEQDADVVLFLSKVGGDEENSSDNRMLTIAKHRNGPTGAVELFFVKEQARFREIDKIRS
ncbi:MAG: replicative DNA helicase [Candidatus Dojkabacteria bacterium]|uniref:Replicative DNA helicase n=2 Tax=Candidatus Dojkabacteria TaxID=74243 RepID=A0A136KJM2_9BACT|nr:MAG: Replicative DNA helicase [candidate division WS6 bacterium OLB21]MBW7953231.1 replicative DNA helicase [Candidatus Dojkabacteria bacterium]WKZ28376.1 MAG: replicative DNA helicase [Candidatus Dojkabacteria bacterium]